MIIFDQEEDPADPKTRSHQRRRGQLDEEDDEDGDGEGAGGGWGGGMDSSSSFSFMGGAESYPNPRSFATFHQILCVSFIFRPVLSISLSLSSFFRQDQARSLRKKGHLATATRDHDKISDEGGEGRSSVASFMNFGRSSRANTAANGE